MNQGYVASLQPPALVAICVREGAAYYYRDLSRYIHTNPMDRPPEVIGGRNTLHLIVGHEPFLLLPIMSQ